MIDFDKRVNTLWSQRPFDSAHTILLGVSGGADSVALLHYLINHQLHPRNNIVVVHVNHGLRDAAVAEEKHVADLATEYGVQYVVKQIDVKRIQKEEKRSIEEAARVGRYQAFAEAAVQLNSYVVIVAHHADDQVETILMNLLRGSGLTGLAGMEPITQLHKLTIFRPFLHIWRSELIVYCQQHDLSFIEDPSNLDVRFQRNKIRHQLIPSLIEYNEQAKEHIWQLAQIVQEDIALLDNVVDEHWSAVVLGGNTQFVRFAKEKWRVLPVSVQRALLRRAVFRLTHSLNDLSFDALENVRLTLSTRGIGAQGRLNEVEIRVGYDDLILHLPYKHPGGIYEFPLLEQPSSVQVNVGELLSLTADWQFKIEEVSQVLLEDIEQNEQRWHAYVAVSDDALLEVRPRRPGERFQPMGMNGTVKVKDVMINEKIPAAVRDYWPILSDQQGILWVAGLRQAQRSAVTATSTRILQITIWKENKVG